MKNLILPLGHYVASALWPSARRSEDGSTSGHPALSAHKPRARFAVLAAGVALALLMFASADLVSAGTADSFYQNTAMNTAANYSSGAVPNNTKDIKITSPSDRK